MKQKHLEVAPKCELEKKETEGLILATQEQALEIKGIKANI